MESFSTFEDLLFLKQIPGIELLFESMVLYLLQQEVWVEITKRGLVHHLLFGMYFRNFNEWICLRALAWES